MIMHALYVSVYNVHKGEEGGIKSNPESSTEINLIYGKVARDFFCINSLSDFILN